MRTPPSLPITTKQAARTSCEGARCVRGRTRYTLIGEREGVSAGAARRQVQDALGEASKKLSEVFSFFLELALRRGRGRGERKKGICERASKGTIQNRGHVTSWGALWPRQLHRVHSDCSDLSAMSENALLKRKREDSEALVPYHPYTKPGERGRAPRPCKRKR